MKKIDDEIDNLGISDFLNIKYEDVYLYGIIIGDNNLKRCKYITLRHNNIKYFDFIKNINLLRVNSEDDSLIRELADVFNNRKQTSIDLNPANFWL